MRLEYEIQKWKGLKEDSIGRRDGVLYVKALEKLGEEPEDCLSDLYEEGRRDIKIREEDDQELRRRAEQLVREDTYLRFYQDSKKIRPNDYSKQRELLRKYFLKFRTGEKQDLENFNSSSIQALFKKMIDYSERIIKH